MTNTQLLAMADALMDRVDAAQAEAGTEVGKPGFYFTHLRGTLLLDLHAAIMAARTHSPTPSGEA